MVGEGRAYRRCGCVDPVTAPAGCARARWPSCSYGAAEQWAEVALPPLNGGVLVEDLAVDIAPGGKVGSRAVAAGVEGRVARPAGGWACRRTGKRH
jgi:hypothetical protein